MVEALTLAVGEEGWSRSVGQEPLADPGPYSVPSYGRDDDDPTASAEIVAVSALPAAASEAPVRAEQATLADTAAEVDDALAGLWGLEYRLARDEVPSDDVAGDIA
jgi:hypothetical protein